MYFSVKIFCKSAMLALLLSAWFFASGQTLITGQVRSTRGETLPGANIYLKGTYSGTSSDSNGYFVFSASVSGSQTLKVDYLGFESFEQELNISGQTIEVEVVLKETFNRMDAVTIKAGTFEAGDRKRSVEMTALDMVTVAGAMGDVYGALQTLPGTTVNAESGKLFVKGGTSEESKTFIDGSLVYAPYGSSPPQMATRGRFDPFMFKGTVFNTGGYSAQYGQALSSVLLLNTTDMPARDELNISLLTVGGGLAGTKRWKSGAVTASFSYSNLKPYMAVVPQNYSWNNEPRIIRRGCEHQAKNRYIRTVEILWQCREFGFVAAKERTGSGAGNFELPA